MRGVIFDLDGVLVDSSPFHFESWKLMGAEHGFTMDEELFRRTFGMTNPAIFELLYGRRLPDNEAHALSERKEEVYRSLARGKLQALPGAAQLLRSLRAAGFRIALGSSAPQSNIDVILESVGIAGLFDATVSANDVTRGKPDPQVFLKAAERLGLPPACCVVVEDAVVGIEAAHSAGMKCVAVTTTHPREKLAAAERVVDSLEELGAGDFTALLAACA